MAAPSTSQAKPATKSVKQSDSMPVVDERDMAPPLNPELLASYADSHHRLLLWLAIVLAMVLSLFPISDPDIFLSLQTGRLISQGQFPWGSDPYGFAHGETGSWVHNGWLGDLVIYYLYEAGGGPLLVVIRAMLVGILFWLITHMGRERTPRFLMVLTVFFGVLTLSHRLYFRTELFSYVLLAMMLAVLVQPGSGRWFAPLHRLTAGRWYWALPVIFLFWANLDGWFFLGLFTLILWTVGIMLKPDSVSESERKALLLTTLLSVGACLATPFHVKSFLEIPARLWPATANELQARFQEQKQVNPKQRLTEQLRLYVPPFGSDFFQLQRSEIISNFTSQAPLLGLFYPSGLSLSEWAFYPLLILVLISLAFGKSQPSALTVVMLFVFVVLACWQSRFCGFLAVGGVALATLLYQSKPLPLPSLSRGSILGHQLVCLVLGLVIQVCCLVHLIPTPDATPSSLGHVHPRGSFGLAFRTDPALRDAFVTMNHWNASTGLSGKAFHFDWTETPGYDVWFRPGSRHLFDRRSEVHDTTTAKDFLIAYDALIASVLENVSTEADVKRMFERQARWQEVFTKYDISHLLVKKRGVGDRELVRRLLVERDRENNPVWRPLQLHNGQLYALAWIKSPHWKKLQAMEMSAERTVFMRDRSVGEGGLSQIENPNLTRYILGDPSRRPPSLDEAAWHLFNINNNPTELAAGGLSRTEVMAVPFNLLLKMASPLNSLPFFPRILSNRQGSAASIYLSLDAVRRAVREMSPDTPPLFRAEVWLQYLQTVTTLSEYEQSLSPLASRFREPQRLFVLRQAALATAEALHPSTFLVNMELAKTYQANGAVDAAYAHTLLARTYLERQPGEDVARVMKNLDATCKQMFGFAPTELQNAVKQQTENWQQVVTQSGWQVAEGVDPAREAVNRARAALQNGLPQKALDELLQSGVKSLESAEMAMTIYGTLGQFDLVVDEFLNRVPELRQRMGVLSYHYNASLGEWCLGRPEKAAIHRLESMRVMNSNNVQAALDASLRTLLGTSTQPVGNVLPGTMSAQQSASESFGLADQLVSAGLFYLEAGKPAKAAELFVRSLKEMEPENQWRLLIERYYLQITGEVLR